MTFKHRSLLAALILAAVLCPFIQAQAPSSTKPSNATGQCKDGTYSTASSKSGACRGHNGVKDWYAATATTPSTTVAAPATPAVAPAKAPAPTATVKPVPAPPAPAAAAAQPATKPASTKGPKANLATTPAAAGGGPNLVWVNTGTNVYHCYGTDFYGKTKAGSYMTEPDAKTKGARPDHGKTCSK